MKLYTFGSNFASQLGEEGQRDNSHIPQLHPFCNDKTVEKIVCGIMHTLILIDGKVYSYGCNDEFALGREGEEHNILEVVLKERVIEISAGVSHSACLTEKGNVYGWGSFRNVTGVVGFRPNVKFQKKPRLIERNIKAICSCDDNISMVRNTGSILVYGMNFIRNANRNQKSQTVLRSRIVMRSSKNKPKIGRIFGGASHCIGLDGDRAYAWGNNLFGQFGNGTKVNSHEVIDTGITNVSEVSAGNTHTLYLKKRDVYACGTNEFSQIGNKSKEALVPVKIIENVDMIASKATSNIAVKDKSLYVWGSNFSGELGFPADYTVVTPKKIDFDFGEIKMIGLGNDHCVVISK